MQPTSISELLNMSPDEAWDDDSVYNAMVQRSLCLMEGPSFGELPRVVQDYCCVTALHVMVISGGMLLFLDSLTDKDGNMSPLINQTHEALLAVGLPEMAAAYKRCVESGRLHLAACVDGRPSEELRRNFDNDDDTASRLIENGEPTVCAVLVQLAKKNLASFSTIDWTV